MAMRIGWFLAAAAALLPAAAAAQFDPGRYVLERVFPDLTFTRPLDMHEAPDGSGRMFVIERAGRVLAFDRANPTAATVVLDLTAVTGIYRDDALMSIAFDPDFAANGYFYLHYSRRSAEVAIPSPNRISRFQLVPVSSSVCDPATEFVILEEPTIYRDHKGGTIAFGPDGMLYVAFGDGGSKTGTPPPPADPLPGTDPASQDVFHTAQDMGRLLGKVLRIDVRGASDPGLNYAVPPDNPFVGVEGARGEIFALGFRNPWRMAFDPASGRLLAADVGWKQQDEISHVVAGGNYGWSEREGTRCFPPAEPCSDGPYTDPIWTREFAPGVQNLSITGGYFYEGDRLPALQGAYLFADFVQGDVRALRYDGTKTQSAVLVPSPGAFQFPIAGFGKDADGEVYVLHYNNGGIYRLTGDPSATPTPTPAPTASPTETPAPSPSPSATPEPSPSPSETPAPSPTAAPRDRWDLRMARR
jgi:glucose/arabinose dehydrogenase